MYGASPLIHLELPGPMDREESAPKDVCREGCYVELYGASGHPDYLSRWRRRDNCPRSERSIDTEVYTFTLPTLKAHEFYLRKPIGELCGDVKIECEKTGLEAILKFHEYDAEFSPAMRNLVTGVVTKKETNEVKRMLFGTWIRSSFGKIQPKRKATTCKSYSPKPRNSRKAFYTTTVNTPSRREDLFGLYRNRRRTKFVRSQRPSNVHKPCRAKNCGWPSNPRFDTPRNSAI